MVFHPIDCEREKSVVKLNVYFIGVALLVPREFIAVLLAYYEQ